MEEEFGELKRKRVKDAEEVDEIEAMMDELNELEVTTNQLVTLSLEIDELRIVFEKDAFLLGVV
ncbi:hypothetical protein BC829DRAFT_447683 [Chytridium lagenaria]|nr:hypothetical protein BC829DRAFT_447683 [Chytridium lagenaria]